MFTFYTHDIGENVGIFFRFSYLAPKLIFKLKKLPDLGVII